MRPRTSLRILVSLILAACGLSLAAEDPSGLRSELKKAQGAIVYESLRGTNWDLFLVKPDGSDPVNLTRTAGVHELYPHVSPDGTKVCFVADEGEGDNRRRSVWYMNMDGTGRTLVGRNCRQPCWNGDGTAIAYLKAEFDKFVFTDFATKGILIYDLKTKKHHPHPNPKLFHLYNLCWSPDGRWFLATVHAGMGYKHAILAIEADSNRVFNLDIGGCRPDISPDGRTVVWGVSDWTIRVGDLDYSGSRPRVVNQRDVVKSAKPMKVYHADWSSDGRYITFSRGPTKKRLGPVCEIVGVKADGWNICVADANATNRWVSITTDSQSNKEPDWAPAVKAK